MMMMMMMRSMIRDFGLEKLKDQAQDDDDAYDDEVDVIDEGFWTRDQLRFFAIDPYCDMYKKKEKSILMKMII